MTTPQYTASKSLPKGRSSYVMSFRHPLRKDPKTGQGMKIRKGLGTSDVDKADMLVAEMNELLSNEQYHTVSMKSEAERKFSSIVVNAFYSDIANITTNSWNLREHHLPLPGKEQSYSRVMLVGTTGAGKTSLLRHLIGSDPKKDRFPSTSTAKTTIADTEIIISKSSYRAVATFFPEASVRASIHECLIEACLVAKEEISNENETAGNAKIAKALLNHPDQKFRLGYTIGSWNPLANEASSESGEAWDDEDEWEEDDSTEAAETIRNGKGIPSNKEKIQMQYTLERHVIRIRTITETAMNLVLKEIQSTNQESTDLEIIKEEMFGEFVSKQNEFSEMIHDIIDEIQKRFDELTEGTLSRRASGWPDVWTYTNEDRKEFIDKVRQLSSNAAIYFGKLLTPIVDGIRVQGPFNPVFSLKEHQFVFIDGQGLGHTPDSASSVTTHVTERFKYVDLILLVDNAKQPMQAAPISVIRSIASSGYQKKLAIAFTHFDQVRGANLRGRAAKKSHVLASLANGLNSISDALGKQSTRPIERNIDARTFMIGGLDRSLREVTDKSKNRAELERLLNFCQNAIKDDIQIEAKPIYDPAFLVYALQTATQDFNQRWDALLGLGNLDGVSREHWKRIWALNRRLADQINIEYGTLRPVADLLARLNEGINRFLRKPSKWTREPKTEEEEDAAISAIQQNIDAELSKLVRTRIADEPLKSWIHAFRYSGRGSSFKRAEDIQSIYKTAAPELNDTVIHNTVKTEIAREFLDEIRQIVHGAIEKQGGKIGA